MGNELPATKIVLKYFLIFMVAVFLSWILHEFAHWVTGEYLGYQMVMTFNSSYPLDHTYSNNVDYMVISAAGPVLTIIEALIIFSLMRKSRRPFLFPFLFTCFFMRLFASAISIKNPNDEARISSSLGIGKFTLPLLTTALLFILVHNISKKYGMNGKFILKNVGLAILFSSVIILTDMYFKIRILE